MTSSTGESFCLKYNEDFTYLYPCFTSLIKDILSIDDFKDLAKAKTESDAYKLIFLKIPTNEDGQMSMGDEIVVPNDGTNETRALLLLQDNGIITLPEGTDASSLVTKLDIVSKSVDVEIVEVEAATVSRYRDQAALVVLNGNYALAAGLSVAKDSIAYESASSSAAVTYVNVVATTEKGKDNEGVKALVEVLESQEIKDFINEKWDGSVVPFTE